MKRSLTVMACWVVGLGLTVYPFSQVTAQIVPDRTLGATPTVVNSTATIGNLPSIRIEGGAVRGRNLFHSFRAFNVDENQRVYFGSPTGIQNILMRVTGADRSEILGTLGSEGRANLILLNPNGVLFGPRSRLDLQGSLTVTTADAIEFGEAGRFSASQPENPANVLVVQPSAYLFHRTVPAAIVNRSVAPAGTDPAGTIIAGLRVPDSQAILLLGGNLRLEGGGLHALGGRVEIGAIAEPGIVTVDTHSIPRIPSTLQRADIDLSNRSRITVAGAGGGDIRLFARNIRLNQNSVLLAGITAGSGATANRAGDILLNASGAIHLQQSSLVINAVGQGATGQGGDLWLTSRSLSMMGGGQLQSLTRGRGNAGSINLQVSGPLVAEGISRGQFPSGIFSTVESGARGNGGNLRIAAQSIRFTDQALISGEVVAQGQGNAGTITVIADSIDLQSGGRMTTSTRGQGNGGTLSVRTQFLMLDGSDRSGEFSAVFSVVDGQGQNRRGGDLRISADNLRLMNGARISTSILTQGDGGDIDIQVRQALSLDGVDLRGRPTGILSVLANPSVSGRAGNLQITAGRLSITNGAALSTSTFGLDDGGQVQADVRGSLVIDGVGSGGIPSQISSAVSELAMGNGGALNLSAASVLVTNGAQISARTQSSAGGSGGSIRVLAQELFLEDGGSISAASDRAGDAGTITILTTRGMRLNNGRIETAAVEAAGGDIEINTESASSSSIVRLQGDSDITTASNGDGGNITILGEGIIALDDSDILAVSESGQGGNITLGPFLSQNAAFNQAVEGFDGNGQVDVNARGRLASGSIRFTDIRSLQNSLLQLPKNPIDTRSLLADRCIAVSQSLNNSFFVTGLGSLPYRPGDVPDIDFPAGYVRSVPQQMTATRTVEEASSPLPQRPWQVGDPMVEPQGVYQLPDGQLVLSRTCGQ